MSFTFHVAFTLEYYEGIAPTFALFIANDAYAFDATKAFEFSAQIAVRGSFVLCSSSKILVLVFAAYDLFNVPIWI